jgi:putative spermidine/putrescine transport system permease protein
MRLLRWLIVLAVLLPFVPLLVWSFSLGWYFPDMAPQGWSGRAWAYLFTPQARVLPAFAHSIGIATAATLLSLLISLPAARALGGRPFRGRALLELLILAPTIVPPIGVAMGIHIAFIWYGLADSWLGVVLVHLIPVTPYMVLVLSAAFAQYNLEYEAQGRTLGARPWQIWWHITLPILFPSLMVASLFGFIISWSQYLLTLLVGGGRVLTLPILLFSFASGGNNSVTAALALLFIAPAVLFLLGAGRYFAAGLNWRV